MRKNTAGQHAPTVTLVSAADGSAITTGASIYVTVDDGTPTAGSGTLAYSANRGWSYAPTQAETNGDKLTYRYAHASAVGGGVSVTVYTSHPQTGDAFSRIGANGAGLTNLGDARLANLDAKLSSLSTFNSATDSVTLAAAQRVQLAATQSDYAPAKAGDAMALTPGERSTLAAAIEGALLNEGDSQQFVAALVAAIGNVNVDEVALTALIRADLEREGGYLNTLVTRATEARLAKLDRDLAHAADAATYMATGFATPANVTDASAAIIDHGDTNWTGGGSAPSVDDIAGRLLVTPANKLATNADGSVNATVSGVDVDEVALASALIDAGVASQEAVEGIAALLRSGTIQVTSPVTSIGGRPTLTIVRGDSYEVGSVRGPIDIDVTDADAWPDLTSASVTLTVRVRRGNGGTTEPAIVLSKSGTVIAPTGATRTFRFEPTAAETAAALVGRHEFDVEVSVDGKPVTIGPGLTCYVVADQTVAT